MDRLHRISQRKEVFVSRLVIRNSVEGEHTTFSVPPFSTVFSRSPLLRPRCGQDLTDTSAFHPDRILALQERKQGLADAALGEGKGGKIGKLSVKQLKQLFGMV
jgi:hypothetical protein